METTGSLIVLIGLPIIENFLKSRAENQALIGCFQGFTWLKIVSWI